MLYYNSETDRQAGNLGEFRGGAFTQSLVLKIYYATFLLLKGICNKYKNSFTLLFYDNKESIGIFMNMNGFSAASAWTDGKKNDPLMLRGSVVFKDVLYRKNSPKKELWNKELAFNYDLCLLLITGIAAFLMLAVWMRRACRRISGKSHRKSR